MHARISHIFVFMDYLLGMLLLTAVVAAVVFFFAIGGAPKRYEMDALGGVYANFLSGVEVSARDLREEYCKQADAETREQAKCNAT